MVPDMTISAQLTDMLEESGVRRTTADRYLRPMRAEGLVPPGQKGGGASAPHFDAAQLANVAIGMAAPEPIRSAETARILGRARFLTLYPVTPEQDPTPIGKTLHAALVRMIEGVAEGLMLEGDGKTPKSRRSLPHFIEFYFSPLKVELSWIGNNYSLTRCEVYANNEIAVEDVQELQRSNSVLQRNTKIPGAFIYRLGELYYDTLLHQSGKLPIDTGSMPVEPPKREDAALPGAASMRTNQPRANKTGPIDTPEASGTRVESQPIPSRRAGLSKPQRSDPCAPTPSSDPVTS